MYQVHPCNDAPFITGHYCLWMITHLSRIQAAERTDDALVAALQAGWPWSSASTMTTKTVILIKVVPSLEPDMVTDNCPIISHLSWHIVP